MGGKGSGPTKERDYALQDFADDLANINNQLKHIGHRLMRIFAKNRVPAGCYRTLFATLQEELDNVYKRSLRLERHARDELHERGAENRKYVGAFVEYRTVSLSGSLASGRKIKTQEDADKLLQDYLPNILPTVEAKVIMGDGDDRAEYPYTLTPEDYCAAFVKNRQSNVLDDLKKALSKIQQTIGDMEAD